MLERACLSLLARACLLERACSSLLDRARLLELACSSLLARACLLDLACPNVCWSVPARVHAGFHHVPFRKRFLKLRDSIEKKVDKLLRAIRSCYAKAFKVYRAHTPNQYPTSEKPCPTSAQPVPNQWLKHWLGSGFHRLGSGFHWLSTGWGVVSLPDQYWLGSGFTPQPVEIPLPREWFSI